MIFESKTTLGFENGFVWQYFTRLHCEGLHFEREDHVQELFVVDGDEAVPVRVLVTEGGGQRLQHHAQLDEVVEDDAVGVRAVELLQQQVVEAAGQPVAWM